MELSAESLAAQIDALGAAGAFISEGEETVTVSNLAIDAARAILEQAKTLGWPATAFDPENTQWTFETLDAEFAPFRVTIEKPPAPAEVLSLLTNAGFASWLDRENSRTIWRVCRLSKPFFTAGASFGPWSDALPAAPVHVEHRSPRTLVREYSSTRRVPADLDRWLLIQGQNIPLDDTTVRVWANKASRALMLSLPDELDNEAFNLNFRGPPRLRLQLPRSNEEVIEELQTDGFEALQAAVAWVFDIPRETEMRHILLATEIARAGGAGERAPRFFLEHLEIALGGAKTAYQVQLAGISSDSLKTLTELRKSVTDETVKLSDATRQIVTSVASALAIGAGLIAARLTTNANPKLITIVMVLAVAYVATTIASGVLFLLLQRNVRKEWQPRLYRFLSEADYRALVGGPTRLAEAALWVSAAIGGLAVMVMAGAVISLDPLEQPDPAQSLDNEQSNNQFSPEIRPEENVSTGAFPGQSANVATNSVQPDTTRPIQKR